MNPFDWMKFTERSVMFYQSLLCVSSNLKCCEKEFVPFLMNRLILIIYSQCNYTTSLHRMFAQISWIIKIFFGKCEMTLCVYFSQQWLSPWKLSHGCHFWLFSLAPVLQMFCYFMTSWMSCYSCTFGRLAAAEKVHHCSNSLHLCMMALTVVHWSPDDLEMAL